MDYVLKLPTERFSEAIVSPEWYQSYIWYERECGDMAPTNSLTEEEERMFRMYKSRLFNPVKVIKGSDAKAYIKTYGIHDPRLLKLELCDDRYYMFVPIRKNGVCRYQATRFFASNIAYNVRKYYALKEYIDKNRNLDIFQMTVSEIDYI